MKKKILAKDLVASIKLLCFIPINKFDDFLKRSKANILYNLKISLYFLKNII